MDDDDDDTEDDSFGYEGEEVVSVGVSGGDGATEDDLNEACSDLDLECETSGVVIRHSATEVFQRCQVAAIQIGYSKEEDEEEEEDQLRDCIATQKVSDVWERESDLHLHMPSFVRFFSYLLQFYLLLFFLLFLLRIVVCMYVLLVRIVHAFYSIVNSEEKNPPNQLQI